MFDAERKKIQNGNYYRHWQVVLRYACVVMSRNFDPLYTLVVTTQSSGGACFYTIYA